MHNSTSTDNSGPLQGLKVLDLTRILAGPTCTQLFGDLGADVIKVEQPGRGDDTRSWGPPFVKGKDGGDTDESAYYLCANRNKRSVAIDIASAEGAETVRKLAARSDILIENFKTGGLARYGLDYDSLKHDCPAIVYCSITGFGQTGPNADKPGYDLMAQGFAGIMSLTGEPDGEPMKAGVAIGDILCGMYAASAILAALHYRNRTGKGQQIDLALSDALVAGLINQGVNYLTDGKPPRRYGNQHPNIVPYQVFSTRNGYILLAVGNDSQFRRFCEVTGHSEVAGDPRFASNRDRLAHRDQLVSIVAGIISRFDRDELLALLEEHNIPAGPVNTVPEVFASDQVKAREMKISLPHELARSGHVELIGNPVKFSLTPVSYRRPPPFLGQHTDEVLTELNRDKGK